LLRIFFWELLRYGFFCALSLLSLRFPAGVVVRIAEIPLGSLRHVTNGTTRRRRACRARRGERVKCVVTSKSSRICSNMADDEEAVSARV